MKEVWKNLQAPYEEYQVSTIGRVRSFKANKQGNIMNIQERRGYQYVVLFNSISKKSVSISVHRLVAQAFIPNPMNLSDVNHKDRNKSNNNLDNLEWVSHKDNINHGKIEIDTLQSLHKLAMKLNKSVDDTVRTILAYYTINKSLHI